MILNMQSGRHLNRQPGVMQAYLKSIIANIIALVKEKGNGTIEQEAAQTKLRA